MPLFFPKLHRACDEDDDDTPRSRASCAHLAANAIASRLARHMFARCRAPPPPVNIALLRGATRANPWKYPFPQAVNRSARAPSAEDADAMATALQPPEDPAKHPCKKMRLGGRQNALPEEFCIAST